MLLILGIFAGVDASAMAENYSNKLLLTGGGLTPWAIIGGYGTNNEIGENVDYTYAKTNDLKLDTYVS